jgi:hypothetical protein
MEKAGRNRQNNTARKGLPAQGYQDRTAYRAASTGLLGNDSQGDRKERSQKGRPEQNS